MKKKWVYASFGLSVLMFSPPLQAEESIHIKANAGLGYSSNVYHSPSNAYFDYAAATPAIVTPDVQAGVFIPLSLNANYMVAPDMKLQYDFKARFHLGSALSNANVYDNTFAIGKIIDVDAGEAYAGLFLGWHTQTYFDKDDGSDKLSLGGTDISSRYNYQAFGFEGEYTKKVSDIEYVAQAKYASLTYDTVVISELDNNQIHLKGYAKIPMSSDMKLKVGYKLSFLDYSKRKARDAAANLTGVLRSYTYHDLTGQLLWKDHGSLRIFLDAGYAMRVDNFVGYNDYTKASLKVRVLYALSQDLMLRTKLSYSNTDYANAFIFEDTALAKKTSSTLLASFSAKQKTSLMRASHLWAKMNYKNVSSNDLRYDYHLVEGVVGADWKF